MREIKFRAWNALDKKMIYQDQENFSIRLRAKKEGNEIYIERSQFIDNFYVPDQGDLMQFTGLHDRNGREIYEGDLIKVFGAESGEMVVHVDDITMMPLSTLYPAGEVIGNIHQNPELVGRVG